MQPGQFLVNKDGQKRKIFGVCGEIVFLNEINSSYIGYQTKESLKLTGWSLLEEPWVPTGGSNYFYIAADGQRWHKEFGDDQVDRFNLLIGNYARTVDEANLYRQKLIETMGRKEK